MWTVNQPRWPAHALHFAYILLIWKQKHPTELFHCSVQFRTEWGMTMYWKWYMAAVVLAQAATSLANYLMDYRGLRLKKKKKKWPNNKIKQCKSPPNLTTANSPVDRKSHCIKYSPQTRVKSVVRLWCTYKCTYWETTHLFHPADNTQHLEKQKHLPPFPSEVASWTPRVSSFHSN